MYLLSKRDYPEQRTEKMEDGGDECAVATGRVVVCLIPATLKAQGEVYKYRGVEEVNGAMTPRSQIFRQ